MRANALLSVKTFEQDGLETWRDPACHAWKVCGRGMAE